MSSSLRSSTLRIILFFGIASSMLLATGGCRTGRDNQIDLLERELRSQEDYIYELEDYVVEYSEKLRECRCEQPRGKVVYSEPRKSKSKNHRTDRVEIEDEEAYEAEADELPTPVETDPVEIEEEEQETPEEFNPEEMDIPDIQISDPVGKSDLGDPFPEVVLAAYEKETYADDPELAVIPDPSDYATQASHEQLSDDEFNEELFGESTGEVVQEFRDQGERQLERIIVTRLFRGNGHEANPTSLLTVIEARDSYDEPIDFDGEVSLMVMTNKTGTPKRLHRWDFTREETSASWQSSELGDGLHLELPLDGTKLPQQVIELWVRVVTRDGQKLLTQTTFESQTLLAFDDISITEETLPGAQPLSTENSNILAENPSAGRTIVSIAKSESPINILRPVEEEPRRDKPRWRAAMQSTHHVEGKYATTATRTQRWIAQPPGGRIPRNTHASSEYPSDTADPSISTSDEHARIADERGQFQSSPSSTTKKSPQWQPYR